ncbi:MAG: hypothetical protein HKO92_06480, partial [Flavobacteriaceae bacterium]|nr:hypothetical protein [Flavobacteriaceae bacterium]
EFIMQNTTFISEHDFTLVCESGEIEYKKGDLVEFCHDEDGNVWISHFEESEDKVHAFEIEITDKDLFSSLLENTILVEQELDDKISFEEMSIDKLLIEEEIDMPTLMQFMVEAAYTKAVRGGKVTKVPVRRKKMKMTPKQKAARMKAGKALAKNPSAKKARAKSMKLRKKKNLESFVIDKSALFDNSLESVSKRVHESLSSFFGETAKVKLTKENKVQVNLFNAEESQLEEALTALDINYFIEGQDDNKVITFFKPQPDQVVESYYSTPLNESDDEEDMDYMEMCGKMHSEMKTKMKEMEESDDEMDMEKAKDMMDSYKEKMKKMKEMEDDKEKETLYSEMKGDYHKFIKMMDSKKKMNK